MNLKSRIIESLKRKQDLMVFQKKPFDGLLKVESADKRQAKIGQFSKSLKKEEVGSDSEQVKKNKSLQKMHNKNFHISNENFYNSDTIKTIKSQHNQRNKSEVQLKPLMQDYEKSN